MCVPSTALEPISLRDSCVRGSCTWRGRGYYVGGGCTQDGRLSFDRFYLPSQLDLTQCERIILLEIGDTDVTDCDFLKTLVRVKLIINDKELLCEGIKKQSTTDSTVRMGTTEDVRRDSVLVTPSKHHDDHLSSATEGGTYDDLVTRTAHDITSSWDITSIHDQSDVGSFPTTSDQSLATNTRDKTSPTTSTGSDSNDNQKTTQDGVINSLLGICAIFLSALGFLEQILTSVRNNINHMLALLRKCKRCVGKSYEFMKRSLLREMIYDQSPEVVPRRSQRQRRPPLRYGFDN
ncbi:hypothetical protein FSP39_014899 [Pinctada imbricata]|uniref:Uncharacterized protein n=1 Tax=Pinctada imbricata TaxID=66713 RepID=A0AA88YIJ2_PINIB|nr:hypothetical protein FSP39_014899 [Pinctada imbricata]